MTSASRVGLEAFIDSTTMSARQRVIVLLVFLSMIAEGLDITIASFVYPQVVREWGTSLGSITFTVTVGVVGMAIGGAVAGPFADRYGRKPTAMVGIVIFGLSTAAMGLAPNIESFAAARIVACVGLGGVMPVVMTIVADWMPAGRRAQMITLTFSGVAVGTIIGGFLASLIIPAFGWPVLLVLCGTVPLLLIPAIALLVPESPAVSIARGRPESEVRATLASVAPGRDVSEVDLGHRVDRRVPRRKSDAFAVVLSPRLRVTTLLLWACFFIGLGAVFLVLNYLPLIVQQAGLSAGQAGVVVGTFGWGGLIGQILVSFALRRFDRFRVLGLLWVAGLAGVWVTAAFTFGFSKFAVVVFFLGLCLPSANAALQAVGALAYPPSARATGMGVASGVGRIGTLTSGLLGGAMIGAGWSISEIFASLGAPIAVGVAVVLLLRRDTVRREGLADSDAGHRTSFATSPVDTSVSRGDQP